ncbi:endolytic transglycosylase MltG [Patescibacteria group bacterium]|nr:endolytic transglycosylase MltG [Patescibacteria group bacterium]MCG2694878.1 endolytic transglycosylase MltG [Candidatus Parcubacteria bacterium]
MSNLLKITSGLVLVLLVAGVLLYSNLFGAPQKEAEPERFIVSLSSDFDIIEQLKLQGFIKNVLGFRMIIGDVENIQKGAYKISKATNAWEVKRVLQEDPYMKWVVIPEGLRKEEIAELFAKELGWNNKKVNSFITEDTTISNNYTEGVYFPDTYLIPLDETSLQVANRLRSKFEEKFAPYLEESLKQNIRWLTLLRIASIVQREAAGKDDMSLIAGILWNRLLQDMKLDVDATLQYARGKTEQGWWAPITPADKQVDSPFNTYKYKGLPPSPISNPGVSAIEAVLFPKETDCIYYLHDSEKQIHCAKTYKEHLQNIETFLK